MRKRIGWVMLCALLTFSLLPLTALAEDTSPADGYNDHDYDTLRTYLETEAGGVKNGTRVSGASYNADDPTTWQVSWVGATEKYAYGINWDNKGLTGSLAVTNFEKMEALYVSNNDLTSIDVTGSTKLGGFTCQSNNLTSLNLGTNTNLYWLNCSNNALTSLNISAAGTNMMYLYCEGNSLTSMNITSNTNLYEIFCYDNALTSLDVSGFAVLDILSCDNNEFTSLDVTGCTALTELFCYSNKLDELDVSTLTGLETLECNDNQLASLDLEGLTALRSLNCSENLLTALDLSDNPIEYLECGGNALTSLDVSAKSDLYELTCEDNLLSALDVSHNTLLSLLYCEGNNLTVLDLSRNTDLEDLACSDNNLTVLDLSHNAKLDDFACADNSLTALDLSHNPNLRYLDFSGNDIASIDISGCALYALDCHDNALTSLDASGSTGLFYLDCTGNPLASVTASLNSASVALASSGNGYVGLFFDRYDSGDYYAQATPAVSAAFYNWTNAADEQVSTMAKTDLSAEANYDLTANFLYLTADDADGKVYASGRITLTPSIAGGTWTFDSAYFSREGSTFTALKAGTSTITYTVDGVSKNYEVTIEASGLPATGQDFSWVWLLTTGAAVVIIPMVAKSKNIVVNRSDA